MRTWSACFVSCVLVAAACGDDDGGFRFGDTGPGVDTGTGGGDGATGPDGSRPGEDGGPPPPVNVCSPGCGPMELCGETGDGNGLDDNCDGRVDEGCVCMPGVTRPCFAGPPDRRNVGTCADGIETCSEFGVYEGCAGSIGMVPEVCDGADNDCNGIPDDGISDCTPTVTCPDNENAPPLTTFPLLGGRVYTGTGSNWSWSVECPPSVPADLCPAPADPTARDTSVYFTASGGYRVSVSVTTDDGMTSSCAWTVVVGGGGLRVELNWDTMTDTRGGTDVDLHLHRWTTNTAGGETAWFDDNDCFYGNCTPSGDIDWPDHPPSELTNCQDAPHGGGARWRTVGNCRNPRLDVDTNGVDGACRAAETDPNQNAFCAPENINVDNPILGMPYRVMVNYYSNSSLLG
ncbi:MAG: hypothetical protein IT379_26730, partial [Deltaproteobacteria bacterium]|nr:hypothetical protein [Deltaproteobacteria bacterium]